MEIFSINKQKCEVNLKLLLLAINIVSLPISEFPTKRKTLATLKQNAIISLFSTHRCIGTVSTDPSWTTPVRSHSPFSCLRT